MYIHVRTCIYMYTCTLYTKGGGAGNKQRQTVNLCQNTACVNSPKWYMYIIMWACAISKCKYYMWHSNGKHVHVKRRAIYTCTCILAMLHNNAQLLSNTSITSCDLSHDTRCGSLGGFLGTLRHLGPILSQSRLQLVKVGLQWVTWPSHDHWHTRGTPKEVWLWFE